MSKKFIALLTGVSAGRLCCFGPRDRTGRGKAQVHNQGSHEDRDEGRTSKEGCCR